MGYSWVRGRQGKVKMTVRWSGKVQVRVKSILSLTLVNVKLICTLNSPLSRNLRTSPIPCAFEISLLLNVNWYIWT